MIKYPFKAPAFLVTQPLGKFFAARLPARLLLDTCYSDRMKAVRSANGDGYSLEGGQRELQEPRLRHIAEYIDTYESAFPNSIIIAPNVREDDGSLEEDDRVRWRVAIGKDGCAELIVPTAQKLAPIIDGQHRLFAYRYAMEERLDTDLVCSVFLDLPKSYQAFLFATINSTQKPVSKSQTYDLFGYNLDDEPAHSWSPDKLSVSLARKLNTQSESPYKERILIAAESDFLLGKEDVVDKEKWWAVSMATVVEGISRLISSNPRSDSIALLQRSPRDRDRAILRDERPGDLSPMRSVYLAGNDKVIHHAVLNFSKAADGVFWSRARRGSFITKTVGHQALFDILRRMAMSAVQTKNVSLAFFEKQLASAGRIDFAAPAFVNASGSGRVKIRKALEIGTGLKKLGDLPAEERKEFAEFEPR